MNYALGIVGNKDSDIIKAYITAEAIELKGKTLTLDCLLASYVYSYKEDIFMYFKNNAPRLAGFQEAIGLFWKR